MCVCVCSFVIAGCKRRTNIQNKLISHQPVKPNCWSMRPVSSSKVKYTHATGLHCLTHHYTHTHVSAASCLTHIHTNTHTTTRTHTRAPTHTHKQFVQA